MRKLTEEEKATRNRMRKQLYPFIQECWPLLSDFMERLGSKEPTLIVMDPEQCLETIDNFMKYQVVEPDDRIWIMTRIACYLGELLVHRFGGVWFLNEIPDSRYFLKYVVGRFTRIRNYNAMVDPFYIADVYVSEPPGRSLSEFVEETAEELQNA
jgi:hypothetical protein